MAIKTQWILGCVGVLGVAVASAGGDETPEYWRREGKAALQRAKQLTPIVTTAKNVILFIGDGMGIATVTASRILEGQLRNQSGEENVLSFERLPHTALIKTYNTNQQTPDSAGTMSAIVTGVKTQAGVLSVNQHVVRGDPVSSKRTQVATILELAERAGKWTGVVSTTSITHATPAACYAHSPDRAWEDDSFMPIAVRQTGFPDLARQLIEFPIGDGLEVALGGGREHFLPNSVPDPEHPTLVGRRTDGRDLIKQWMAKSGSAFVWNSSMFDAIDVSKTKHLLGLFSQSHMAFEHDRVASGADEPSLTSMTEKAIRLLSRGKQGFFLMVEGGRIDHAHHFANAFHALTETIEFASAVEKAVALTDRADTLIIVTADHSHVFTMGGDATRGNPILGKVTLNGLNGKPAPVLARDALGLPYTVLGYADGPGYTGPSIQPEGPKHGPHFGQGYSGITKGRPDLTNVDTAHHSYLTECTVPLAFETHGGEDVPLYADGPSAHLFHGVLEQNVIFYVMADAMGLLTEE